MVKALFDTNILIDYLNGVPQARVELALYSERAISIISWMEVMVGTVPDVEAGTRGFLGTFTILSADRDVAERAFAIRKTDRIKLPDAIIRATADVHAMLLVTRNTKDFPKDSLSVRVPYTL